MLGPRRSIEEALEDRSGYNERVIGPRSVDARLSLKFNYCIGARHHRLPRQLRTRCSTSSGPPQQPDCTRIISYFGLCT